MPGAVLCRKGVKSDKIIVFIKFYFGEYTNDKQVNVVCFMSDDGVCHGEKFKLGKKGYRHVCGNCFGKCDQIGP